MSQIYDCSPIGIGETQAGQPYLKFSRANLVPSKPVRFSRMAFRKGQSAPLLVYYPQQDHFLLLTLSSALIQHTKRDALFHTSSLCTATLLPSLLLQCFVGACGSPLPCCDSQKLNTFCNELINHVRLKWSLDVQNRQGGLSNIEYAA